ncbi:MAG: ATP-binding protein [Chlamydiota bacterium]
MRSFRKKLILCHLTLFCIFILSALFFIDAAMQIKLWFFGFCALTFSFCVAVTWRIFYRIHFPIQQNLLDERNEKGAILESLDEGVIAVDGQMQVCYINAIGAKMVGISRRKLIGNPFPKTSSLFFSELLDKCTTLLATCQTTGSALTDSISMGEEKRIYFDLIAVPKTQSNGAILILQDKSSHYRVLEMGKDFVANASHELRTPITIIKGFAETMQDLPELPREMVADMTEKIVRNCQRMDTLVKNLLTLADLDNLPESRFQDCDLAALAEACREVVQSVYKDASIEIDSNEEPIAVNADPDILELAIINLLDNAAKYSNSPAQICMKIWQEAEEVHITISDKGIGIPLSELEHIFDRFYTVDKARSRRFGGAGLGLSIVRTIVEKHHGSISALSQIGEGTTFTIVLPSTA